MPQRLELVQPTARPVERGPSGDHAIRVVLADDHPTIQRSLRWLLDAESDIEVIGEAADLPTAKREVERHRPDVLVLDLRLPDGSVPEWIRKTRMRSPETEIVVITMYKGPALAGHTLDAGACGFVLKDSADQELPEAIRRAARGDTFTSPRIVQELAALERSSARQRIRRRERDD